MPRPRRREVLDREIDPVLHSGVLFKRGYGRLLGRKTWKPRHFVLTRTKLRYFTFENGKLRDEVDLRQCTEKSLEIMPTDICQRSRSAASIWRLALNVPQGRRVIMAAPTEFEMNAWIKQIRSVLRNLGSMKTQQPEAVASKTKPQTPPHQMQDSEETKEEEPPCSNQSDVPMLDDTDRDRAATATWKTTTTDFQNFVAQPRRSMIFRRQSFEGQPIVPGVYRHSTGQLDDRQLQKELEELRAEIVLGHGAAGAQDDQDDVMDEEEEEALLQALRQFSKVHRGSGRSEMEIKSKSETQSIEIHDGISSRFEDACTDLESPIGPIKPIFYYKQEDSEPSSEDTTDTPTEEKPDAHGVDEDNWFSRVSNKFHRHNKQSKTIGTPRESVSQVSTPQRTEDGDTDLPAHFHEDPASSKPRRYSTGSMLLTSERSALTLDRDSETEREEALIQELLTGLVFSRTDEASTSQRDFTTPHDNFNAFAPDGVMHKRQHSGMTPTSSVDIDELRLTRSYDIDEMRCESSVDIDEIRCSDANTMTSSSELSSAQPSFGGEAPRESLVRESQKQKSTDVVVAQPQMRNDDVEEISNETWFKSFKAKWRASRDEKKERKRAAKQATPFPAPSTDDPASASPAGATETSLVPQHAVVSPCEAASVASELVTNLDMFDYSTWTPHESEAEVTSPCSTTMRGMLPRQLPRNREAPALATANPSESQTEKRGIFGRWRDKLRDKQPTHSRRHSMGETIPGCVVSAPKAISPMPDGVEPPQVAQDEPSQAQHFSARYRRDSSKPRGLIELQNIVAFGSTQSTASGQLVEEGDSEDEVVVVVVRRRHSIGCADDDRPLSSHRSQKRVKYRVYVDVGDDDDIEGSGGPSLSKRGALSTLPENLHHVISPSIQPSRICAA